jgi:hypothetical protein
MKQLLFAISTILLFSCNSKQNNNNKTAIIDKSSESIKIDTITYKVNAIDSIKCGYYINQFNYPQISSLSNRKFQNELNDKFTESVIPYIESIESNIKTYNSTNKKAKKPIEDTNVLGYDGPIEINVKFNVLSNKDSILSIIQYFIDVYPGGASGQVSKSYTVINCNYIKGSYLNNYDLNVGRYNPEFLNNRIKSYFDQCFPEEKKEGGVNYPFIKNRLELNKLNYGIRNDSIMLFMDATPSSYASSDTYVIPIDKWKK